MQVPVAAVLQANTKREQGKKAQYGNIMAAKVSGVLAAPKAGLQKRYVQQHAYALCCRLWRTSCARHWAHAQC